MKFLLGKKLGMTQIFDDKGNEVPVTLVETGDCIVTQVKTKEGNGYNAIQFGFLPKSKKIKKTDKGKEFKYLRELRFSETPTLKVGDKVDLSIFKEGEEVRVSGITKGKGFTGAMKKWGFHGLPETHGSKHEQRSLGSTGIAGLRHLLKGTKMAGRMGSDRLTVKNLKIAKIDKENNIIAIIGAVPGNNGGLVEIKA